MIREKNVRFASEQKFILLTAKVNKLVAEFNRITHVQLSVYRANTISGENVRLCNQAFTALNERTLKTA